MSHRFTNIKTILPDQYPKLLREIPNLPKELYLRGELPSDDHIYLTVVGPRRHSDYGAEACRLLINGLKGLPVVIVSGLAYGIDRAAHEAALEAGLKTIAVPGSSLDDGSLYPAAHRGLARRILAAGGALLSPFPETTYGNDWTFPFRNRIMAGMSKATLIVEGEERSGTLITANHALEFSRDVLVVPGLITSPLTALPHLLLYKGAKAVTSPEMLAEDLGFSDSEVAAARAKTAAEALKGLSPDELAIVATLCEPIARAEAAHRSGLPADRASAAISLLEIKGLVEERDGRIQVANHFSFV